MAGESTEFNLRLSKFTQISRRVRGIQRPTTLDLGSCTSFAALPSLGQLRALTTLNLELHIPHGAA